MFLGHSRKPEVDILHDRTVVQILKLIIPNIKVKRYLATFHISILALCFHGFVKLEYEGNFNTLDSKTSAIETCCTQASVCTTCCPPKIRPNEREKPTQ